MGDAAHVVHPLAGQGVNLGFGDAQALTSAISHAVSYGGDVGDISVLQVLYLLHLSHAPDSSGHLAAVFEGSKHLTNAGVRTERSVLVSRGVL